MPVVSEQTSTVEPLDEVYMTPAEVVAILRVSPATLNTWRHRKVGPPWVQLAGSARYPRSGLELWLRGRTECGA
jgi:hypothetical protein